MNFNPERLIAAREVRNLTQPQLSTMSAVDQASISRYESGLKAITENDIQALSEALEFPPEFFFKHGEREGAESGEIFHRKRASMSSTELRLIHAQLNIFRWNLDTLLIDLKVTVKPFDIPQYNVQKMGGDIDAIAEFVREAWKIPSGPIQNLTARMERAFCFIHAVDFNTHLIDETGQWCEPMKPVILVNKNASGDRLRFSLAHALGHLIMHHDREPYPEMEKEADQFAAAFLMPTDDIKSDLFPATIERLLQLKPIWKVSVQALLKRALDLGVINESRYKSVYQMLSRAGYRKKEPFPLDIEQPKSFANVLKAYQQEKNLSISRIANEILAISERDFMKWYLPNEPYFEIITHKNYDNDGVDRDTNGKGRFG